MDRLPIRLSQASGVPFYRQIVDQLAALIRSGQLPPGRRLPSFRELSVELLVSLITVRRAYSDLEAAGLIVRRQGQGTFVAAEVEAASRQRALAEARAHLAVAVDRARQLGLRGPSLRSHLESLLEDGEGGGERARPSEKGREHGRD
jgi:GntR family transcriptional regulator